MSRRASKSTANRPALLLPFGLFLRLLSFPYTAQTTSSFILAYDSFNPFLIHMPCFVQPLHMNQKWVEAIIAKNLLFVYRERMTNERKEDQMEEVMLAG